VTWQAFWPPTRSKHEDRQPPDSNSSGVLGPARRGRGTVGDDLASGRTTLRLTPTSDQSIGRRQGPGPGAATGLQPRRHPGRRPEAPGRPRPRPQDRHRARHLHRAISGLTVRCLRRPCPVCGHVVLRADGGVQAGATCCGQLSGNRCHCCRLGGPAAVLLPQPRRSCPLVVVPVDRDRSAGRSADSRCPRPVPHRRSVSEPVAHNGHMQWLHCGVRRGVRPAGRVDRWADTPTVTVPAGRTCDAVGVRPPWPPRCWGSDSGGTCDEHSGRFRRCRPWWLSGVPGTCGQPAAFRHGLRSGVTATGTGRRGGGGWWDAASADGREQSGWSGGCGAGRGHRSSAAG
jgi:hypothetical protein